MKHFLFLLFFAYTTISFSQAESNSFKDKYEEFDYYAKPDKTNNLSKYFKRHIDSRLFDAYKTGDTVEDGKHVYLTFGFDAQNKVTNIVVKSPYSELNKNIREAFNDFDIEKLNIPIKSKLNTYRLQILSKENDKMIINCSTNVVYDQFPFFEGCESINSYYKAKYCFDKLLEAHVAKYFSPDVIKKAKVLGSLTLNPEFIINEKGAIEIIQPKLSNDSLTKELNRVVALFPKAKIPPLRNGKPTRINYRGNILLQISTDNKEYIADVIKTKDSTLNPNSELALHFKKFIRESELVKNVFPLSKESVEISFSIDEKGKMIDINASTGYNPLLNNRLIEIFKKYPIEKLNIKSSNIFETYKFTIITKGYPLNVIQCNETPNVYIPAYFDKNCEKLKSSAELAENFHRRINETIIRHLSIGKTKFTKSFIVFCDFKVDTDAKIVDVKVSAPSPNMTNDLEQIIRNISIYKPAYLNGKAIKSSYSIPIRFAIIGENNF